MANEQQVFIIKAINTAYNLDKTDLPAMAKFVKKACESQYGPTYHVSITKGAYSPAGV